MFQPTEELTKSREVMMGNVEVMLAQHAPH